MGLVKMPRSLLHHSLLHHSLLGHIPAVFHKRLELTSIKLIEFGTKSATLWLEVLLTRSGL
jgi:hypothetical protein